MATRLLGSTTGGSNAGAQATHTVHLLLSFPLVLHEVRFFAAASTTYDVRVGGESIGSVTAAQNTVAAVTLDPPRALPSGMVEVALVPAAPVAIRRTGSGSRTQLDRGVWQSSLQETTGHLVIAYLVEGGSQPDGTGEWVCSGYVEGKPRPMPGVVVNGGQSGRDPHPLPLFGRERPPGRR